MEKRRKIKRIFSLFFCFLFLCVSLVGFIPSASAFSYAPKDPDYPTYLSVFECVLPFDKFTLNNRDYWTIPSPFLSYNPSGYNDSSWIQSNEYNSLWVLSTPQSMYTDTTGEKLVTYKLTGSVTSTAGVHVNLSTDRPFVTTRAAIAYFFNNFKVRMYPYWNLSTELTIHCKQPVRYDFNNGFELVDCSFTTSEYWPYDGSSVNDKYSMCFDIKLNS